MGLEHMSVILVPGDRKKGSLFKASLAPQQISDQPGYRELLSRARIQQR